MKRKKNRGGRSARAVDVCVDVDVEVGATRQVVLL